MNEADKMFGEGQGMTIKTVDMHAAGEPLRIILEGYPHLDGETMVEKREAARLKYDHLRRLLMWEPRGHADMYGAVCTEPVTPDGHLGVIFLHNEGYSTMCGHGIIALTTAVLDTGMVEVGGEKPRLLIDTPAGRVTATAVREKGRVRSVSFLNVPSFVLCMDERIDIPGIGSINYDIAFGGAFYVFCRAEEFGFRLVPEEYSSLIEVGRRIKQSVADSRPILHPFEAALSFLYGTIFVGPARDSGHHSRNVCIFADGELDRSPTGTGVSARAALHFSRKEIGVGDPFVVESILGTCFTGKVLHQAGFGPYEAVIPQVSGRAFMTGRHEFIIDREDPLKTGFLFR
jgi:proline racemase